MKPLTNKNLKRPASLGKPAFALVVTLSLMILLTIIALGLLSLSTISLRSSSKNDAMITARSNARMAMMIAIGRLQAELGSDQRITANAAITETSTIENPQYLGVWDSWKAGVEVSGNDQASHHPTISTSGAPSADSMHPSYESKREDHFREWLVSSTGDVTSISLPTTTVNKVVSPAKDSKSVTLVGTGTLGDAAVTPANQHIAVELIDVHGDPEKSERVTGRYGFWVGDESQKARILGDQYEIKKGEGSITTADSIFRNQAVGSPGIKTFAGMENIPVTLDGQKAIDRAATFKSLERLSAVDSDQLKGSFLNATTYSLSVLSDVREGGLKKDLTTLLEQPINRNGTGNEYMLARFSNDTENAIPIQDLATYYQLYRDSNAVTNSSVGYNVTNVDFGSGSTYKQESSNIYRQPVPVKLQFVVSFKAQPRTENGGTIPTQVVLTKGVSPAPDETLPNNDTHRLVGGAAPLITMWNPYNVPLTMRPGDPQSTQIRFNNMPISINWTKVRADGKGTYETESSSSLAAMTGIQGSSTLKDENGSQTDSSNITGGGSDNGFIVYLGGTQTVTFEPGEVKMFSLRPGADLGSDRTGLVNASRSLELIPGWDPTNLLVSRSSIDASISSWDREKGTTTIPNTRLGDLPKLRAGDWSESDLMNVDYLEEKNWKNYSIINKPSRDYVRAKARNAALTFSAGDTITAEVVPEGSGPNGAPMRLNYLQSSQAQNSRWGDYTYLVTGPAGSWKKDGGTTFYEKFIREGFGTTSGSTLINESFTLNEVQSSARPLFIASFFAGVEVSESSGFGTDEGRKYASRPFLHSSPVTGAIHLGDLKGKDFYQHGWSWRIKPVSGSDVSNMGVSPNNVNSYYGGGFTPSFGTTHVVQQEIPLVPPISIASLSHAQLGGFSIANETNSNANSGQFYRQLRAMGQGGIFPHMVQAIGNSYAHPAISSNAAVDTFGKVYHWTDGGEVNEVAVDQSYVMNKALWDDYFFSSITSGGGVIMPGTLSAQQRAQQFLDGGARLPNPRFIPYTQNLGGKSASDIFASSGAVAPATSLAVEQIAAHIMVEGGFNVNSTSVEAWKGLFSSMRDKSVASLPKTGGTTFNDNDIDEGGAVSGFSLPVEAPSSSPTSSSEQDQWYGLRQLTDPEIDQLANKMVEQVKLRGPFLSLSEFVNRRLSSGDLAVKGALQAALDDDDVDINKAFRAPDRTLDPGIYSTAKFPEALDGPVAYGSSAYVDQADVLRGLAGQLTVRGDTFIIRAYGDALDASGNILARAWCEAVVQRTPEYLDKADEDYKKYDNLSSSVNKQYGRRMRVIQFRYLNPSEI